MPTITSAGIGSGLDVESLISKLVAVERQPINQLSKAADGLKTELSAYGKTQGALATLRDAASRLTNLDTFGSRQVTSSSASAVSASAGTNAPTGSLSVEVKQLATAQSLVSATPFASTTSTVGQGSLTIQLGSYGSDADGNTTFTPKANSAAVTISIGPGQDSLTGVRDAINKAGAGVTASILTDATGSRLVLRSTDTGAENGFTVASSDAGLSALAFDPSNAIAQLIQTVPAANARALLNGVEVNSASNSLKEALDGISLTLLQVTTAAVTVTVGQDRDSINKAITDFTTAYNAVNALLRSQTKYDQATKTAGPLQGDSTAVALLNQLRSIVGGATSLAGKISRLSDLGIQPGTDGNLTVNSSKLNSALGDPSSVQKLLSGVDATNSSNSGFAVRLRSFVDQVLGASGSVSNRQAGLQKQIDNNSKQQAELEDRVNLTTARLRAQYNSLDTKLTKLNGLASYVSQQFSNNSGNK